MMIKTYPDNDQLNRSYIVFYNLFGYNHRNARTINQLRSQSRRHDNYVGHGDRSIKLAIMTKP